MVDCLKVIDCVRSCATEHEFAFVESAADECGRKTTAVADRASFEGRVDVLVSVDVNDAALEYTAFNLSHLTIPSFPIAYRVAYDLIKPASLAYFTSGACKQAAVVPGPSSPTLAYWP